MINNYIAQYLLYLYYNKTINVPIQLLHLRINVKG